MVYSMLDRYFTYFTCVCVCAVFPVPVNDEDSAVLGIRGVAIDGPDRRTLTVGQSVELRCTVKGLTNARISWRRPGGAALPPGHSVSNGVLFIPNIEPEDSGEYICTVTSDPVRPDLPRTENRASVYIIVTGENFCGKASVFS